MLSRKKFQAVFDLVLMVLLAFAVLYLSDNPGSADRMFILVAMVTGLGLVIFSDYIDKE